MNRTEKWKIGVVEQKNRDSLFIASRTLTLLEHIIALFTLGLYPKPTYYQIGVYVGNVERFEEGDKVNCLCKKDTFLEFFLFQPNIVKIEKVIK